MSAAGFIATSTSGRSPGVRMSWSAKCSWKDETPASVPCGARISAGKFGKRRQVVAEDRGLLGEPVPGQLHAVAGVAGDADDDPVELLDVLGHQRCVPPGIERRLRVLKPGAAARSSYVYNRRFGGCAGSLRVAEIQGNSPGDDGEVSPPDG